MGVSTSLKVQVVNSLQEYYWNGVPKLCLSKYIIISRQNHLTLHIHLVHWLFHLTEMCALL